MTFGAVVATERLKLKRSRVPSLTLLAFGLGPLGGGLFVWMVMEPGRAAELGLLGAKADILGLDASWAGYLAMLTQMVGIVGTLVLAVMAAYVFGREYAEGTARNMLTLPVPRFWFVLAKLVIIAGWWLVGLVVILAEAVAIGAALGLPGWSLATLAAGVADVLVAAGVVYLLTPVVAWIAALGRGYLPPLGFAMVMLVLGNVLGATGWGKWFPWTIAPLFAGVAGPPAESLAAGSLLVVWATFGVGVIGAAVHVSIADVRG